MRKNHPSIDPKATLSPSRANPEINFGPHKFSGGPHGVGGRVVGVPVFLWVLVKCKDKKGGNFGIEQRGGF
jgi:hypothetical protein